MSSDFSVEVAEGKASNIKVLHIKGELDEVSIEELKKHVDPILTETGVTHMIFDFTNLEFINSKGIGYLVSVHTHLTKDGRNMAIAAASEPVMDVLSLVGLNNIIPYHATLEEALSN